MPAKQSFVKSPSARQVNCLGQGFAPQKQFVRRSAPPPPGREAIEDAPSASAKKPHLYRIPTRWHISRICGVVFDFNAQASDVYVHDLQLASSPSPTPSREFLPGGFFPRVVHKQLYDGVLHLCKLDPLSNFFSRVRLRVFSRKGGWLISPVSTGSPPPVRR